MRLFTLLVAVPVVPGAILQRREPAPLLLPNPVDFRTGGSGGLIDGQYIVKFKDGIIGDTIKDFFKSFGSLAPSYVFDGLFSGFAAPIDAFTLQALRFAQIVSLCLLAFLTSVHVSNIIRSILWNKTAWHQVATGWFPRL